MGIFTLFHFIIVRCHACYPVSFFGLERSRIRPRLNGYWRPCAFFFIRVTAAPSQKIPQPTAAEFAANYKKVRYHLTYHASIRQFVEHNSMRGPKTSYFCYFLRQKCKIFIGILKMISRVYLTSQEMQKSALVLRNAVFLNVSHFKM